MAYSTQSAVSDGTLSVLPLSIDYLSRDDITVYLGSAQAVKDVAWSWVGTIDRSIKFTPAVPAGVTVTVKRSTGVTGLYHKFSGGAQFTSKTLDESLTQTLFVAQEFSESSSVASDDLPLPVGSQASAGKSNRYARADHVHVGMTGGSVGSVVMDTFTGDGAKLAFTLANTPVTKGSTQVFIDSVYQSKTAYTLAGPVITFDEAPAAGAVVEVITVTIGGGKASDVALSETPEMLATDTGGNVQGALQWIAAKLKVLASDAGSSIVGYLALGGIKRTLQDKLREIRSLSDYATLQAAITAVAATGGTLRIPTGTWAVADTISAELKFPVVLQFDAGATISKTTDGDLFSFTLTNNGTLAIEGYGSLYYSAQTSSATAAAVRVVASNGKSRGFVVRGGMQILCASAMWKYGFHLTDVQDPDIDGTLFRGIGWGNNMVAIYGTAINGPSVSWSLARIDVYEAMIGVELYSGRGPGIEGIKVVDCDFVAVKHGLKFTNDKAGYSPPQIELIGVHVNSYDTCVSIYKAIQVSVSGGLYYRDWLNSTVAGVFFSLDGVQDCTFGGGVKMSIVPAGLDVPGIQFSSVSQVCAYIHIDQVHFWANGRTSPVFKFVGNPQSVVIGGGITKDTNGAWISTNGDLGAFKLSQNAPINAADYWYTVMTDCPVLPNGYAEVNNCLWGNVNITGATSGGTVNGLWHRRPGMMYKVKCDTVNVTIPHSADNNLRGAAPFVFGTAGDTIDLYSEANTLREHARRAT